MVELTVKLSPKGQVLIPKIIRDYYKMYPEENVVVATKDEGVLIKKQENDIIGKLKKLAEEASKKRGGKPYIYKKEAFYEQYDKRAKRAGL